MEGKVLSETFSRIFEKNSLDADVSLSLKETLGLIEETLDGLAFCLSSEGDILSQWRGYASDGEGFSIGFSKEYLEALSEHRKMEDFLLRKVIYDPEDQENAIRPVYEEIKKEIDAGKLKVPQPPGMLSSINDTDAMAKYEMEMRAFDSALQSVKNTLAKSFKNLYTLKNSVFSEECEWRLISFLTRSKADRCLYRVSANRLTPYRSHELVSLRMPEITEVYLGPKNQTPEYVVKKMLEQHGFAGVTVRRSKATYR